MIADFINRLRALVRRDRFERDLDDELRFHLEQQVDKYTRAGFDPADARRKARLEFGSAVQVMEECRESWGTRTLHEFLQDTVYALRSIRNRPAFGIVSVLTLAFGIGANTALFSLWYGVVHSTLPIADPERLVMLSDLEANGGVNIGITTGVRGLMSYPEYELLRDADLGFTGVMAAQSNMGVWQARLEGSDPEEVRGRLVSGGYFAVLGVAPRVGRTFTLDADRAPSPYAVISYDFWQRRFGGDPSIIGQTIRIGKSALTILGVMPAGFFGETTGQRPDMWIPLTMQPEVQPGRDMLHDTAPDKIMWLRGFARLKPDVTIEQARRQTNAVFKSGLMAFYGTILRDNREDPLDQSLAVAPAATGASDVRGRFSDPLTILLFAVGVVLLIACANLANLLLARGAARQPEIGLRLSLGASRRRIARQLVTENLVIAALGGVAGLGCAYLLHRSLTAMIAEAVVSFRMDFQLDPLVLGFTLVVTLAAALVSGLLPIWHATRAPGRFARRAPWARALVTVQLALSLPLLIGAGLLARTLYNLQQVDLGYPADRVLGVRVDTLAAGYTPERALAFLEDLRERFKRLPGVTGASYSRNGVFGGRNSGDDVVVEGYTPQTNNDRYSAHDMVGPRFFSSLGVPIRLGREITEDDRAGRRRVVVINDAFARRFFAGRNPLGARITNVDGPELTTYEVVGVLGPVRMARVRGEVPPIYYVPAAQPLSLIDGAVFAIRTSGEASSILPAVRQIIGRADASVPIVWARPVQGRVDDQLAQDRLTARLAVAFGGVALLLAAIGLYGVLSFGVAHRTGEFATRLALGALPRRLVGMLLREMAALVAAGLLIGALLAWGTMRLVASQLYGLTASDPVVLWASAGLLLTIALLAVWLPARRAAHLDPAVALRRE